MAKNNKYISQKNNNKLKDIGKKILRLMNQNSTKVLITNKSPMGFILEIHAKENKLFKPCISLRGK